jgi:hypothetical protein
VLLCCCIRKWEQAKSCVSCMFCGGSSINPNIQRSSNDPDLEGGPDERNKVCRMVSPTYVHRCGGIIRDEDGDIPMLPLRRKVDASKRVIHTYAELA